ncbi:MAG: hypothetical protein HQ523_14465 [Lentisphaerae bacterium]|nr:hypothetical protein [Lentisphaerota bacterium]
MRILAVIHLAALLLAVMPRVGRGSSACFYRVVSTQATTITHFDSAVGLTWSNAATPAECIIQWTPALTGLWLTNHFPCSILSTSTYDRAIIPTELMTGTPSTIFYQASGGEMTPAWPSRRIDIDRNGSADLSFDTEFLSTDDVPSSGHSAGLRLETLNAEIILRPYTNGEVISESPPSGDTWQSATGYHYFEVVGTTMNIDWETEEIDIYPRGPWQGVTTAYLPVRLRLCQQWHYGWVQMKLDTQPLIDDREIWWGEYTIIDCALQAMPNTPIQAGEGGPE